MRLSLRLRLLFAGIALRAALRRTAAAVLRPIRRLTLAVRYFLALDYSWRLAWAMAERRPL